MNNDPNGFDGGNIDMTREYKYDNIKAILIFLVVFGHIVSRFAYETEAGRVMYNIIYSFHMPSFLFITGYFAKYNPKALFKKYLPCYFMFQIINFVVKYAIFCYDNSFEMKHDVLQFIDPGFTLWYIIAIMVYQLLIPLFKTNNNRIKWLIPVLAFLVGIYMGFEDNFNSVLSLPRIICFFPYYILGYYEKESQLITSWVKNNTNFVKLLTMVSFLFTVIAICYYSNIIEQDWLWLTANYESTGCTWYVRILLYIAGIIGIITLIVWIPDKNYKKMAFIGRNTLQIYLYHAPIVLVMEAFDCFSFFENNIIILAIASLAMVMVLAHFRLPFLIKKNV